jgi:HK97 family phage major capsid protein
MALSKRAALEIVEISGRAEKLARGSANERKQADILVQRIASIKLVGLASSEVRELYSEALVDETTTHLPRTTEPKEYRGKFESYVAGKINDREFRDFLAGTQSITATAGASGGFTVPFAYDDLVREAMAQVDPVLDPAVCDFSMTPTPTLQPSQVSGYDLSTVEASNVAEAAVQNPQTIPNVLGSVLNNSIIFRASFAASIEAETDIPLFAEKITRAGMVALARRVGQDVMTGHGGTTINGVVRQLGSPVANNGTAGKLTLTDLNAFYFSVNRFYRKSKKAGWLFSDGAYKILRAAVDNSGRPLLDVENDDEKLLGAPVYNSPSMTTGISSLGTNSVIFGDLSHLVIRASRPQIQRSTELSQADVTKGECLYVARIRADAAIFDPSNGVTPPIALFVVN